MPCTKGVEVSSEKNMMACVANPQIKTTVGGAVIQQFYTGCLAQAAYYIESNGEAAIVDPLRDTAPYLELAKKNNAKITHVLETHFHADFVSGHVDLAKDSGADIVFGPTAQPGFDAHIATDGESIKVGNHSIVVLHTPGHTLESSCFLLRDAEGKDVAVFTGDTLFIGDVGRPDLAQKAASMTQEELAEHLYNSLRNKLMTLGDDVIVYPGHGAGSACGKNLSTETASTIGKEKATNYALRATMNVDEFVGELITGLNPPPEYFPDAVWANKNLNTHIEEIIMKARTPYTLEKFVELMNSEPKPLIVDTRDEKDWTKAHVAGTVFCGIDGNFGPWVGTAFPDNKRPVLFIPKTDCRVDEIATRLARIGFDNSIGYLEGGFATWKEAGKPVVSVPDVTPEEIAAMLEKDPEGASYQIIDVRNPGENTKTAVTKAVNIPLQNRNMTQLDKSKTIYTYCAEGYRSVVFMSAALMNGFPYEQAHNITGGFAALQSCEAMAKHIRSGVCPRTGKAL